MDKFLKRSTVDLYLKTVLWSEKSISSTVMPGLVLRARRWRWHSLEIFWVLINFVILSCDGTDVDWDRVGQYLDKNHLSYPQHYAYHSYFLTPISGFLVSVMWCDSKFWVRGHFQLFKGKIFLPPRQFNSAWPEDSKMV